MSMYGVVHWDESSACRGDMLEENELLIQDNYY